MATYTIIGGDQKPYSSVSPDDIRRWIADGRLNEQSLAKEENDTEWRPLSAFPEFADAFAAPAAAASSYPAPAMAVSPEWLEHDYELDIGGCIGRGWELLKNNFGLLFASFLIYMLIEIAIGGLARIPFIGPLFSIANLIIAGPLMGGLFYVFIQAIRSRPAGVGDMFAGFSRAFGQLFLGTLVSGLLVGLCLIPFVVVFIWKIIPVAVHFQHAAPDRAEILTAVKSTLFISLPVLFICLIPVTYLAVNWKFTLPLIVDRQLDFWTAMKASWKMVNKHWWHIFGLLVLIGLLNVAGFCVCCVGVLFTAPIGLGALMYAYETIFAEAAPPGR
jgi:hypothetical protein